MAYMVMSTAMKVTAGKDRDKLRATMMMNIAVDFAIGLVPFLGDIADTFFRCNTRNAVALEKMLNARVKASEKRAAGLTDHVGSDESLPPAYTERERQQNAAAAKAEVQRPPNTKTRARSIQGWFGAADEPEADLELGKGHAPPRPPRK